jgi:acyl CoA:acetate/3-ketoacid CoA transferase beta subunit
MTGPGLAELCIVACAQAWRGDGAILASPMGLIPSLGARLAQLTFSPQLLVTDGEAMLIAPGGPQHGGTQDDGTQHRGTQHRGTQHRGTQDGGTQDGGTRDCTEGWLPYRDVLRLVATGRRHMMMGAAQIDRYGNQNISCIGDWARPKAQLLGVRGAPGNTINHPVSYWIPRHSPRVFVDHVDMVSGIGYDRAAALTGRGAAFHQLRVVVSDKAVLDFATAGHSMRLRSVHPGVSVAQVQQLTGFDLVVPDEVPQTPRPTAVQLALIRDRLDPGGLRDRELA